MRGCADWVSVALLIEVGLEGQRFKQWGRGLGQVRVRADRRSGHMPCGIADLGDPGGHGPGRDEQPA